MKTPLSYAGGKSRFLKQLDENTPNLQNVNNFYDLFLGGGSFSIYISKKYPHLNIYVNDLNTNLINFWKTLQNQSDDLIDKLIYIKNYKSKDDVKEIIFNLKKNKINNNFDRAVGYYITNKCSFAGTTESGGFSNWNFDKKFNVNNIKKLEIIANDIKNWIITNSDYKDIKIKNNSFIYLDPPYNIKAKLYGKNGILHKEFDFINFINFTKQINQDCLISFNDDSLLDYFNDWIITKHSHTYLMRTDKKYIQKQKKHLEVLIKNYQITREK